MNFTNKVCCNRPVLTLADYRLPKSGIDSNLWQCLCAAISSQRWEILTVCVLRIHIYTKVIILRLELL